MPQSSLYFHDGEFDNLYRVTVKPKDDGYIVSYTWGRTTDEDLTIGTKTESPVSFDEAMAIYDSLNKELMGKGYATRTKWEYKVTVSRRNLYIEPAAYLHEYFDYVFFKSAIYSPVEELEIAQGFMSLPERAIIYCGDIEEMTLESELTTIVPPLDDAVEATSIPIEVSDDYGLALGSDNRNLIDIPRGKYDMLFRIFPLQLTKVDYETEFDHFTCKGSLSFLPRGTIGIKCFKKYNWGFRNRPELPSRLVIYMTDGGIEEFPV